jgi:hypothetical protein
MMTLESPRKYLLCIDQPPRLELARRPAAERDGNP